MASETGSEPSVKKDLLASAKRGEITPEEAEDEALLAGCGPLALGPNSSDLDPIAEPTWTLLMTLERFPNRLNRGRFPNRQFS